MVTWNAAGSSWQSTWLTPNGREVNSLTCRISLRSSSGERPRPPTMPSPPALLTAATSSAVVYLAMPAWKIGTSIPNSSQTGV